MGRFARSWELAKQSYAVLKSNPQLALFPLVSGIASFIVLLSFLIPAVISMIGKTDAQIEASLQTPLYYVLMFAFYTITYFIVIFFNCGLVYCAYEHLNGRPATFRDGIAMARRSLGQIIVWTLIAATVGTILKAIAERAGWVGQLVINLIGLVWSVATFFVVPLLIVERETATASVKRSAGMLKRTWGVQIIGGIGINLASSILMLFGLIPIVGGVMFAFAAQAPIFMAIGFGIAVLYWLALATVFAALGGIFQTALYIYASNGEQPSAFSGHYFQEAFVEKPRKKFFGREF